jgi:hypothetical protein
MSEIKTYWVEHSLYAKHIMDFLKKWHYSNYVNLQHKETFTLWKPGPFGIPEMIGVCIYTRPAGPSAAQSYWPQNPEQVLELRRLCLIDDTPKNAESFFVGSTLRWLKKNTVWEYVISYADEEQGHTGVIYRASNFKYLGKTKAGRTLEVDGEKFHIRTLTMIDRPYGVEINKRYKAGDEGIKIIETLPKNIYTYLLKGKDSVTQSN